MGETQSRLDKVAKIKFPCFCRESNPGLNDCIGHCENRDSSVGIALGYGLDDWDSRVRFSAGAGKFSLHHRVQNGSGAYPASYPMGTRGSFRGGKAAGTCSWRFTSNQCRGQRMSGAVSTLTNTPSWRGAQLKHRNNFIFIGHRVPLLNYLSVVCRCESEFHALRSSLPEAILLLQMVAAIFDILLDAKEQVALLSSTCRDEDFSKGYSLLL
jgi:hypothetical protein